jgi:Catalase
VLVVGTTKFGRATLAPFISAAHPGFRANDAKGIVVEGSFKASSEAPLLSKARLFDGSTIPVTVRFSDSTGIPNLPDGPDLANPHGMAIKFHLPDGSDVDMVSNSLKFFLVSSGADSAKRWQLQTASLMKNITALSVRARQQSWGAAGGALSDQTRARRSSRSRRCGERAPNFLVDELPQPSDIDRKTALADTGTTSWQTRPLGNRAPSRHCS